MSTILRLSLLLLLGFSTTLFSADGKRPPSAVEVTKVTKGVVNPLQDFVGTVYYTKSSDLASKESGAVEKVNFSEGDFVKKGTTLYSLDSELLQTNIQQTIGSLDALQADLQRLKKEFARAERLYNKSSISEQNFDNTKYSLQKLQAQYDSASASLNSLYIQKRNREIKAPFDGVVTAKHKEIGEWVSTGSIVAKIVDTSSLEIVLNVPSRFIAYLDRDSLIRTFVGNQEIKTELLSLIPQADIKTRTFPVKLKVLESKDLIEGMSATVALPAIKQVPALLVPRDAVIKKFGQEVVFTVKDGKANMVPVQVVGFNDGSAAVMGQGLVEGAQVVTKGNERIFPNSPVRVVGQ